MENIIMKNRPFKRILSVVLAVVMVITLMPLNEMTVQAADGSVTLTYDNQTSGGFSANGGGGWNTDLGSNSFKLYKGSMTISSNSGYVITKVELKVDSRGGNFDAHCNQVTVNAGNIQWDYGTDQSGNRYPAKLNVTDINKTSLTITNPISVSDENVCFNPITIYYHNCSVGEKKSGQAATCTSDGWNDYYQCSCGKVYESTTISNPYANLAGWKASEKGKIPKLGHDFVYSENDNKIEAYCNHAADGGCEYTEANKIALTLTADDRDYSGDPYTGASVDNTLWSTVGATPPEDITYYLEDGETLTTAANSGAEGDGKAPVYVGKYVAKISVSDLTASKAFAIKHVHGSWEYSAEEATLTAECKDVGNGNGECTLSASENKISLSLTAEDAVYSGNVVEASYVGGESSTTAWKEETKQEAPVITYFVDESCENKTGENDGASSEGKAPINVGTYYAAITEGGATAKICFTIAQKKFKQDAEVTLSGDGLKKDDKGYYYEWDDTVKTPTITVKDTVRNQVLVKDKEYSVNGGQSGYDIGSYTISLNGKGNYTSLMSDGIKVTWEIRKATIHPTISVAGWTYGQKANKPAVNSTAEISGNVTYTYYTDDTYSTMTGSSEGATTEGGVPKNAGTYYVKALFEATDNYEETEATCSFTIQPRPVTIVPDDNQSKIYGEADPAFTYDDSVLLDGDTLNGCLSRAEGEDTGTYEIRQDAEHPLSNPNYEVTVASGVKFSIKQKKLTQDMITVKPLNYQFSGDENKPELVFDDKTLVVEGTKLTTNDTTVAGDTAATKYGVYTIIITGKENYKGYVEKKWFISPVKDTTKVWTGEAYRIEAMEGVEEYVDITYLNNGEYVAEAPAYTEPGEYEYTYKMVVYEEGEPIAEVEGKAILTIEKALVDAEIILSESIVYGQDYEPSISNNPENAPVIYEYKVKNAPDSTYSTTKPEYAGNYTVRATIGGEDGTEHYKQTVITRDYGIEKIELEPIESPEDIYYRANDSSQKTVSLPSMYNDLAGVAYQVGAVEDENGMLAQESVSVAEDGQLTYTLAGINRDATAKIPVTITSTNYKDITIYQTIHIDVTAPSGTITVANKTWTSFLNQITFGMFFKKSRSVSITAEDTGIGMDTVQYYVSGDAMTGDALQQLDDSDWKAYEASFAVNPNSINVIYAKLTDKAGNTSIINSDGIVIYTDSEQKTEEINYTRTTNQDVEAEMALNGNTIKEVKNGETELTMDTDYTISEDGATITFTGTYLETLAASGDAYTITVSYNPLGKEYQNGIEEGVDANEAPADTTIALYVKKAVGTVTGIQDLTKTYDATPVGKPTFNTTNTKGDNDANVTIEYKDADAPDSEYTQDAPVDSGEYMVRVTVASDGDYLEAVGEKYFTIDPKDIKATVTAEDKTYDGTTDAEATAAVETGIEGQTLVISDVKAYFKDANVVTRNYVSVDSRATVVTAGEDGTKEDNYNIIYPAKTYANINPKEIGVSWGDTELPYTGSAQAPTVTATGLVEGESCVLTMEGAQTDVGEYEATVTGVDNANYTLPKATQSTSYRIVAVDADYTAPVAKALTYDGQPQALVTAGSTSDGTMMYRLSENESWSSDIPAATDADTYTVYYMVDADNNHIDSEPESVSVTIDKKEITISDIAVSNKEYDGTTDADLVYSNVQYGGIIAGDTLGVTAVGTFADKNAGTDKNVSISGITLSGNDANNYKLAEEGQQSSTTASITAKAIGITWDEKTSFVYDGMEHAPTATATGLVEDDSCSLTISGAAKNAGQYTATVTGLGNNNYKLSETAGANTKAFEITKVSLKLKVEDVSKHIGTEDPEFSYSITEGALVEGDTITGITYDRTAGEEAGTYSITATDATNENPNYNITITDGTLTIKAHTEVVDKAVAPSCTETGLTEGKHCSVCNKVLVAQKEVAAKGHTEVVDEAVEATCTETGLTAGKHCSVCNEVLVAQEEVAAKGHTEVVDEAVEATCTETGLTAGTHCSVCKEVLVAQEEVAAKGHTEVVDEAVEATCTETGLTEGKHCSVCNKVLVAQTVVPAKGHTEVVDEAVEATCTETGLTEGKHCSVCNEVLVAQTVVPAKGHTEVVDEAVAPTCTETGLTEGKHCSVCNEVLRAQEVVKALGHDWSGEWTTVKEATATADGKKEKTCKRDGCNKKKYDIIPAIGTPEEPENPNAGKLDKEAEVEPDAPITEATLDNKKSEILAAPAIFTEEEKQAIESGADARIWLEVADTDESLIPDEDKANVTEAAKEIMGEDPSITYFDAELFKQVEGEEKTQLHEPGIDIQVTIKIPDELLNHDKTMVREYKIIRLHYDVTTDESMVDVLSGDFNAAAKEFSFKTDKFSTYAIAYSDNRLVSGVTLDKTEVSLTKAGETAQLTATVAPADAANKKVAWTSSNPKVAIVDENGKVTAVGGGTCTITATTEDGEKAAECKITVNIPSQPGNPSQPDNPSQPAEPDTTEETQVAAKQQEKNELALNAGLKVSQTGSKINVIWGEVKDAEGYEVYVQYCGKKFTSKSINSVNSGRVTKIVITKVNGKKLDLKKNFKVYVRAYKKLENGKKVTLGKTITAHIVGRKNTGSTNVKEVKVSKSSYTLKVGKSATIKAKTVLVDKKKKQLSNAHAKQFRYASSDKKVATVSSKGKITAVGKGSCVVYVYARNGYAKKVKVTVK